MGTCEDIHSNSGEEERQGGVVGRKKSVFHNFQKHLITFVKKTMLVHLCDDIIRKVPELPRKIIKAFQKTRSYNKSTLHMLFGVGSAATELPTLLSSYPTFRVAI